MKVFISWSGEESRAVALVLREELPCVINAIKPFVSSEDIDKGTLWFQKIASELENSDFGIICLTETNQNSKWVLFEAGALAGRFSRARVAPLLVDTTESSITQPLGQFQLTSLTNKDDFFKLLKSINAVAKESALNEEVLKRSFENWWNPFSKKISEALATVPKKPAKQPERTDRQLLEEILSLVRSNSSSGLTETNPWASDLSDLLATISGPVSGAAPIIRPPIAGRPTLANALAAAVSQPGISGAAKAP
jgi:hypothetical protein